MMEGAPQNKAFGNAPKSKVYSDWNLIVNNIYGGDIDLAIERHQSCADSALNTSQRVRYELCVKELNQYKEEIYTDAE